MRKLKITELNRLTAKEFEQASKTPLVVVLDNVRSLHNVGSVFRTCDAFFGRRNTSLRYYFNTTSCGDPQNCLGRGTYYAMEVF